MTYKIEYDSDFPGFRLELNGQWCDTVPTVAECLHLIAKREGFTIPLQYRHSESLMLGYVTVMEIVNVEIGDW